MFLEKRMFLDMLFLKKWKSDIVCQLYFKKAEHYRFVYTVYMYSRRKKTTRFPHHFGVFSKMVLFPVTVFSTIPLYCTSIFMEPKIRVLKST